MLKKYSTILMMLGLVWVMLGCSGGKMADERTEREKRQESFGKLFGDDLLVFGKRNDNQDETNVDSVSGISHLQVSSYLWLATLDAIDFMPLLQADRVSGVVLTDWYRHGEHPEERFKVDVKITSRTLRSDGLQVRVFKQRLKDSFWVDEVVPKGVSRSVEDVILNKARQLKATSE